MAPIGIIGMVSAVMLSAATPLAPASRLYSAAGEITSIQTTDSVVSVEVNLEGSTMPYDGHIYEIRLTDGDVTDWKAEQGPISVGDRVFVWMDSRGTASVLDDKIDHIRK